MEPAETTLLRLIAQVYDAALDPARWGAVVDAIREAVGGEASAMLLYDFAFEPHLGHPVDALGLSGYEASTLATYQHYAPVDTRMPLVRAKPVGSVYVDDRDFEFRTVKETEIFNDFFLPRALGHGMAVNLFADDSRASMFSIHRHLRHGSFEPEANRLLEALAPHITRALQIHRQAALLRIQRDCATQALDALAAGLVVADRNATVLWANETGERLLRAGDGLGISRGRLAAPKPGLTQAMHAMIAHAVDIASGKAAQAGEALRLERRDKKAPLTVLACPLRPGDPLFYRAVPAALVLVNDPDRKCMPRPETLARFYGLTSAQADLLTALVDGQRIADYADEKGIALSTAKTHLKHLFEKTGENRQSDLVRAVLTNPVLNADAST